MNFNLDGKTFTSLSNSENGEVSSDTLFHYHQDNDVIWAEYGGGDIDRGTLLGKVIDDDHIEFNYHHISQNGDLKAGTCKTNIKTLPDGRLKLHETWQWFSGDRSAGSSELIEKRD